MLRAMCSRAVIGALLLSAVLGVKPAIAQEFKPKEAGDFVIRVRGIGLFPDEEGDLEVNNMALPGDIEIDDALAPELDISYFFTDELAVELILATANFEVDAEGTPLGDVDLGDVRLLPPTLLLQYHPLPQSRISPYVGIGINYTVFFDVEEGDAEEIDYEDRFGFALQVGADYAISGAWFVNVDLKKIFVSTDVEVEAAGTNIDADVSIDPLILGVGVGYRF